MTEIRFEIEQHFFAGNLFDAHERERELEYDIIHPAFFAAVSELARDIVRDDCHGELKHLTTIVINRRPIRHAARSL